MPALSLFRLAAACGLLAALLATDAARAERRVALVIGNSGYQNVARLDNPVNDARSIAELFQKAGFDVVTPRTDLGVVEFKRAIREFVNTTRDADIAVVFYAGHGIEVGGVNYLIPVDAKLASDLDAEDEAVEMDRLVRAIEPARRLRLVILDACRDNPFAKKMQRTIAVRAVGAGLTKVEPTSTNTLIAYAARAGSTAEDGTSGHSPFTAALLGNLIEPGLDVRLALGRVRDEVLKKTGNRQEPFVYGSLGGATVSLVPPPEQKKVDTSLADMRTNYEMAERIGTLPAWDSFLAAHATGFYADLARAQRAKLLASQGVPPPADRKQAVAAVEHATPTTPAETATPDRLAWQKIQDTSDTRALRDFIKRFPASPLALTAQHRLDLLEQAAAQRRQQEAERQKAEREAALQRQEDERRAKAAEAERHRLEREAARQRRGEEQRAKALQGEREKAQREMELACRRDEAKLARLRAQGSQARDELARFRQELGCERIRGDVALLEQFTADAARVPEAATPAADTPQLVRSAQTELRRIGCYAARPTGVLDDATRGAIHDYLARRGQELAEIRVTEALVADLREQAAIESCMATPERDKVEPVARPPKRVTTPSVERRKGKSRTEQVHHDRPAPQKKREARPAHREAPPRAKAEARQGPRGPRMIIGF